ncbi:hypothetical protein CDA63_01340 [Hymenobacter amundsenii]|uniref:Cytochrome c domain-containing protein n=1 Tax=Hymenobacter amundsenii TaxID=2006685 RepID=A0A246FQK9_9BACT|nr:cytochrome c [Hymenobacter amundsenii]OWP65031.1 hypothetical protein CDA63_01340 [Hymenobacter amundsenii]
MSRLLTTPFCSLLALAILLLLSACGSDPDAPETAAVAPLPPAAVAAATPSEADDATALATGETLFAQNCALCHGANGKLGLNGAHDLTKSNLNAAGRTYMVVNGLGKMPSFKGQLTEEQIQQVVAYSLTLQ